jgi:hypothetical protein
MRLYGGWPRSGCAKTTGFQGKLRLPKKRGYTPLPKMRKRLENRTPLWFLPPQMIRIFAETSSKNAEINSKHAENS